MMESCLNHKPGRVGSITVEDLRKDLFDDFANLSRDSVLPEKEHLQVYLRVRPFTSAEEADGESQECISFELPDTVILKAPRTSLTARHSERFPPQLAQRFQFSQVYGPETTQRQIFDGTTKRLVKDVLVGGNSLIFTYGVTNAGKTFTFLGPESDGGILPRSLNVIFNSIEGRIYSQNNIKPHQCVDFIRLTKEQQDEEATNKRNLLRRFKDNDSQKTLSSMSSSSCSSINCTTSSDMNGDSVCLDETSSAKFSVWVSFCEIYNENIHDLLDLVSTGSHRRNVLRLTQDFKGNAFVKDLKWVQVNNTEEALKVVKIGRKNQSFSSTKLNNISSRSHSIFSIRILRIEDTGVPHVQAISELSLCDLAGSERCAKTQNQGERLKEARNINTSLLTLGKCINALKLNHTHSKFHQHIPFRESKLTHYLQGYFCGRGKACMIININQCASVYDETLNVLKFSAMAKKVVVLNPKPAAMVTVKRSARDVSMIINNADKKDWTRRSSLMGWEMSLEDVQEDEEMDEDELESDDESMEDTEVEAAESGELSELQVKIEELKEKLAKEESEKLSMEARIREEVTTEFMELFSNMEKDYNERLQREKEIVEERAERRLEIWKNLVNGTISEMAAVSTDENAEKEAKIKLLGSMVEAISNDLAMIKGDAEAVQMSLTNVPESTLTDSHLRIQLEEMREELLKTQQLLSHKTRELETRCLQAQELNDQLLQANRNSEKHKVRCQELMSVCQEKDEMVSMLQTALDQSVEAATKDKALFNSIKEEMCKQNEDHEEMTNQKTQQLLEELKMKDDQLNELKLDRCSLEKTVNDLSDRISKLIHAHEVTVATERAEVNKVTNENKALGNELHELQQTANEMSSNVETVQMELSSQIKEANELSKELDAARALIKKHQAEYCSLSKTNECLMAEADNLRQELCACQLSHCKKEAECERTVELSLKKSRQINDLEQEGRQTRANICQLEELCSQLKCEREAQAQEYQSLLSCYEAQKLVVAQIKSNSELLEELTSLKHQLGRMEEQDSGDDLWKTLQDKLIQTLSKLNQHEEVLNIVTAIVENEISKARDEAKRRIITIEKDLAYKNNELKAKSQELLKLRELENDGLKDKLRTVSCHFQQVERERSDVRDQLCEANMQKKQLEKQILFLNKENKMFKQRLCEAEEMRDQAGRSLSCTGQNIDPLQTVQSSHVKEENIQPFQTTCQDLAKLSEMYQKPSVVVSEEPQQEHQTACRPVESKKQPNEVHADDKQEKKQGKGLDGAARGEEERAAQPARRLQDVQQNTLQLELETLNQQDNIVKLQRKKDDLAASLKHETQKSESLKQTTNIKAKNEGDSFNLTQEKPGEEESEVKLRRTARKRKRPDVENSVESENLHNRRLKTPTVQEKCKSKLKQKDSPASLKGKKDRALQKIGGSIQNSPTLCGSKASSSAKKNLNMVNVKSPVPPSVSEKNNKPKKSKRKLFKTQFSSPLDIPFYPIIGGSEDDKESDDVIIKREFRARRARRC